RERPVHIDIKRPSATDYTRLAKGGKLNSSLISSRVLMITIRDRERICMRSSKWYVLAKGSSQTHAMRLLTQEVRSAQMLHVMGNQKHPLQRKAYSTFLFHASLSLLP